MFDKWLEMRRAEATERSGREANQVGSTAGGPVATPADRGAFGDGADQAPPQRDQGDAVRTAAEAGPGKRRTTGILTLGRVRHRSPKTSRRRAGSRPRKAALAGGLGVAAATALAAPAAAAPSGVAVQVAAGDTVWSIAARFHSSVSAIAAANQLADPQMVQVGMRLVIPPPGGSPSAPSSAATGGFLVVHQGDTLWGIAQQVGVPLSALAASNGLSDPSKLSIGTKIVIPQAVAQLTSAILPRVAPAPAATGSGGFPRRLLDHPRRLALQPLFARWAAAQGVPVTLLEALCWWESGWQAGAQSPTGAYGIGQLEPQTLTFIRKVLLPGAALDPRSASDNIEMAAAYLRWLLDQTGQRPDVALASYYQGLSSVQRHGILPSTRPYVDGILGYARRFAG